MADVKFIRKHGRIIPIRSKGSSVPQKAKIQDVQFSFKQKKTTAGGRAKDAAKNWGGAGAFIGGLSGLQFGLRGGLAGAAIGGAALAGLAAPLAAAFGSRKQTVMSIKSFGTNKGRFGLEKGKFKKLKNGG